LWVFQEFAGGALPLLQFIDHYVQLVDSSDDFLVSFVACDQRSDRTFPALDFIHQALEFADCRIQPVVESGVIDYFPNRTLATLNEGYDAVEPLEQCVHVLQSALAGADDVLNLGSVPCGECVAIDRFRSLGEGTADIDIDLAEYPGRS